MTTLSTHDSKRGEDTNARISTLTEIPERWRVAVRRWAGFALDLKTAHPPGPDAALEYLFYQAIVGVIPFGWHGQSWPQDLDARLSAYVLKAAREAKQQTSWTNTNQVYEESLATFVRSILASNAFREDLARLTRDIDAYAATNALAQTVLRLTIPGVADTYQGTELWAQTLVDPDNRRPVDFALRARMLAELRDRPQDDTLCRDLLASYGDGRIKLHVVHRLLSLRRSEPSLFLRGGYSPLPCGEHVVAFARNLDTRRMLVFVPRLSLQRTKGQGGFPIGASWLNMRAPIRRGGRFRELFTGKRLELGPEPLMREILADFPVAVLTSEDDRADR
jgi:(1->4)-alpha-D-glucan 1-alpha-D-glucosylmutase